MRAEDRGRPWPRLRGRRGIAAIGGVGALLLTGATAGVWAGVVGRNGSWGESTGRAGVDEAAIVATPSDRAGDRSGLAGVAVITPETGPAVDAPATATSAAVAATAVPGAVEGGAQTSFAGIAEAPAELPRRTRVIEYRVEAGDVLWQIAEKFGLRTETVLWANDLEDPNLLRVGETLAIPPEDGVMYTVQADDRLADIATRYGVDMAAVVRLNGLASVDALTAQKDLFLPGGRPLRRAPTVPPDVVQAPESEASQESAVISAPVALPPHIGELVAAGWLRTEQASVLYRDAGSNAAVLHRLPADARLERLDAVRNGRIQVRDPGDGRTRQAMTGWVSAFDLGVGRAPAPRELSVAYPESTAMDIAHVFAPYRSQLDGSAYALANCGPTAVAMALEAFGISVSSRQVRAEVLNAQRMWGNNVGTLITALAEVTEAYGLQANDLYARGGGIYRWTLDDIREHVGKGHPVVVQTRYRSLPGRANIAYYGDHYVVVTGVLGGGFIYNDPIDVDGLGWDRVISGDRLRVAMDASDRRYAYAAFAVSR